MLRFAIVISVDEEGMVGYDFDLRWDADSQNEFDLVYARARFVLKRPILIPGPPPTTVSSRYDITAPYDVSESSEYTSGGNAGYVLGWHAIAESPSQPFISSVSFRVGVVAFHVNDNLNSAPGPDIELGFFSGTGYDGPNAFGTANLDLITPNFGSFTIDTVPEPGPSLFIGMSVLSLILVARFSRDR